MARLTGTFLNNSTNGTLNGHQYKYNQGNQRTQQVFTAGNYENYGYDNIGQLTSAFGSESGGATNRLQEQFGYNYDAAHNLAYRTNNALVQNFMVNTLAATQYRDNTFARAGFTVTNGNNAFTAAAADGQ